MYAIAENEKIAGKLQTIANWFREKPEPGDGVNGEEREKLLVFADQIEKFILEPYDELVQAHYARLEKEEEEKDEIKKEANELMNLSKEELVEKYMRLKYVK